MVSGSRKVLAVIRLNVGCGPDLKKDWINIDHVAQKTNYDFVCQNILEPFRTPPADFILINHVLCTMNYQNALEVLKNAHIALKAGGKLQVIDMDLLKAFDSYNFNPNELPIKSGSDDYKLCMHISGFSTRMSLYTPRLLKELLLITGFREVVVLGNSEHDLRPLESVIVEATK